MKVSFVDFSVTLKLVEYLGFFYVAGYRIPKEIKDDGYQSIPLDPT